MSVDSWRKFWVRGGSCIEPISLRKLSSNSGTVRTIVWVHYILMSCFLYVSFFSDIFKKSFSIFKCLSMLFSRVFSIVYKDIFVKEHRIAGAERWTAYESISFRTRWWYALNARAIVTVEGSFAWNAPWAGFEGKYFSPIGLLQFFFNGCQLVFHWEDIVVFFAVDAIENIFYC